MYECAMLFVKTVTDTAQERDLTIADFHIEERIECLQIHEASYGSSDLWFHDEPNMDLFIFDYKHGHLEVEVKDNWQTLNYASGICSKIAQIHGQAYVDRLNVWICIVQPRSFHGDGPVRYWLAQRTEREAAWGELAQAADRVYGDDPQCTPGKWCRHCSGRRGCKAASNAAMFGADMSTGVEPQNMNEHEVGVQLSILERAIDAMEYRKTGLQEQATSMIKSGKRVTGYGVEPQSGHLAWNQDIETCLALEVITGIELKKPVKLITPTQAKHAGVPPDLIDQFASRPHKGMKLVASDTIINRVFS